MGSPARGVAAGELTRLRVEQGFSFHASCCGKDAAHNGSAAGADLMRQQLPRHRVCELVSSAGKGGSPTPPRLPEAATAARRQPLARRSPRPPPQTQRRAGGGGAVGRSGGSGGQAKEGAWEEDWRRGPKRLDGTAGEGFVWVKPQGFCNSSGMIT